MNVSDIFREAFDKGRRDRQKNVPRVLNPYLNSKRMENVTAKDLLSLVLAWQRGWDKEDSLWKD